MILFKKKSIRAYARIGNAYSKMLDFKNALKHYDYSLTACHSSDVVQKKAKIQKQIDLTDSNNNLINDDMSISSRLNSIETEHGILLEERNKLNKDEVSGEKLHDD